MVAAAAPSTASRTRTLAPLVSAASAWFCCVGASWLALLYRTWAPQSLATSASKRGLSLLSYRAVLVSGRRSAIFLPLPLAPPLVLELPQAATIITLAATRASTLRDLCIRRVLQPAMFCTRTIRVFGPRVKAWLLSLLPAARALPQRLHHGWVRERGGITQGALLRHVAEEAPHDLDRAGLG